MRIAFAAALLSMSWGLASCPAAQPSRETPTVYEVMVNGESFLVEGERVVKVTSQQRPGTSYELAVRVAPNQRARLANVVVDYDRNAKVERSGDRRRPGLKITHDLGFTMLLSHLGESLDAQQQEEALKTLTDSVVETYREMKVDKISVGKRTKTRFENNAAEGVTVHYVDAGGIGHTSLVYVLTGKGFVVSCMTHYLDDDAADVLPLIKRTLESIRVASAEAPPAASVDKTPKRE